MVLLDTCRALEREGFSLTLVPVDGEGLVDPQEVARAITPCGYPRRFHSRFFMTVLGASAQVRSTDAAGRLAGDGELEDLGWVPVAETRGLPLAAANAAVLHEVLTNLVARHPAGAPWPGALAGAPAPCFTWRGPAQQPYRTVIGRGPG